MVIGFFLFDVVFSFIYTGKICMCVGFGFRFRAEGGSSVEMGPILYRRIELGLAEEIGVFLKCTVNMGCAAAGYHSLAWTIKYGDIDCRKI